MAKECRVRFEFAVGMPDHTWHLEEVKLKVALKHRLLLERAWWEEARTELVKRLLAARTVTAFIAKYYADLEEWDE